MSGGPSHIELFDPKPRLQELQGKELPHSLLADQRLSANTLRQDKLLMVGSPFDFTRYGKAGVEMSELLPHTGQIVDDIAIVRGMQTDSVNHDPAITFLFTGTLQPGRPTIGSWLSYGLGSVNKNLPEYVVLLSGRRRPIASGTLLGQRLFAQQSPGRAAAARAATRCSTSRIPRA